MAQAARPACSGLCGDQCRATHAAIPAKIAKRHDQPPNMALASFGAVDSVSRAIAIRLAGRLTKHAPTMEPSGAPITPHAAVAARRQAAVSSPSVKFVSEILR